MSLRYSNKRAARQQKQVRWYLVHIAGCTYENCCLKTIADTLGDESPLRSVKVPRSLRQKLGLRIGGRN